MCSKCERVGGFVPFLYSCARNSLMSEILHLFINESWDLHPLFFPTLHFVRRRVKFHKNAGRRSMDSPLAWKAATNTNTNTNSSGWNPSWVWTVWKRSEVAGTRPAVVFAPFGRSLRVNGGWRETDFWDVCSTVLWGWKLGLDGLETVWGVWNQARSFGNSILNIFLFWKISIRRLVPELVFSGKKTPHQGGGGGGGPFSFCKKNP